MPSRRYQLFLVGMMDLIQIFDGCRKIRFEKDMRIVRIYNAPQFEGISLVVYCERFKVVPEGCIPPQGTFRCDMNDLFPIPAENGMDDWRDT